MIHNLLIGLHIIAVIAWMAGLLYLPRLFAYHTRAEAGSQMDETFKVMEAKLMAMIMRPAMIAVLGLGFALAWYDATQLQWGWGFLARPWMLLKLTGVAFLLWWHHFLIVERKRMRREPVSEARDSGGRPTSFHSWRQSWWFWLLPPNSPDPRDAPLQIDATPGSLLTSVSRWDLFPVETRPDQKAAVSPAPFRITLPAPTWQMRDPTP